MLTSIIELLSGGHWSLHGCRCTYAISKDSEQGLVNTGLQVKMSVYVYSIQTCAVRGLRNMRRPRSNFMRRLQLDIIATRIGCREAQQHPSVFVLLMAP